MAFDDNNTKFLYHYYEESIGPFINLSDLDTCAAEKILDEIRSKGTTFAAKRSPEYIVIRKELEQKARKMFICKGGKPNRSVPHYMTLGPSVWLLDWYEKGKELSIHIDMFPDDKVSFTYGDLFPTMRYGDGKPYRKNVYRKKEIYEVIKEFGFPQEWNKCGTFGPERYIEAQVWTDEPLSNYLKV